MENPLDEISAIGEDINGFQQRLVHEPPFKICYKVIDDREGIRSALHLRYVTYRQVNFIGVNRDLIDVDAYDYYSTILGAYHIDARKQTLIGTMRIVSKNDVSKTACYIKEIVESVKSKKIRLQTERAMPYPLMESFSLPDGFPDGAINSRKDKGNQPNLFEISRLAIRPDYWFRRIDVGLHHLLILNSWVNSYLQTHFMVAVHPRTQARYERIGMQRIPETGKVLYKHVDQFAIAMFVDLETLLERARNYRESCEAVFPQYKKEGYFYRTVEKRLPINMRHKTD
ncbi:MAG: hypothetical protein FVQ81_13615 [Candidatus Glassbacteria bacterium]|nr:hypothetical protein [Candidatus Glassbacteria bacterium]